MLAVNCRPDALFWLFSASKPYAALMVHRLAADGALALDDPVAAHWPAFARNGKDGVTVRQVLQHRSGVAFGRSALSDVLAMSSWDRSIRAIEAARPRWPPGAVPAYHYLTYGFILGELVRRVAGMPVPAYLRVALAGSPRARRDVPRAARRRVGAGHVPIRGVPPVRAVLNRRASWTRSSRAPAWPRRPATWRASTRGCWTGWSTSPRPSRPSTSEGEVDRVLRLPIRWAQGFQLGGPSAAPAARQPLGVGSSPRAFGHNGSYACLGWADPTRRLAFGYVTPVFPVSAAGAGHVGRVSDAVLSAGD